MPLRCVTPLLDVLHKIFDQVVTVVTVVTPIQLIDCLYFAVTTCYHLLPPVGDGGCHAP